MVRADRQFLKSLGHYPIAVYNVASKSNHGETHEVKQLLNGKWECDCIAGRLRKSHKIPCRHIRIIKNKRKELYEND